MMSRIQLRFGLGILAAASLASPLAAENASFAQFAPAKDTRQHRIDFAHWDEALSWFVIPMGPSIREGAGRVEPRTGTRRIYGHESRYRLEGNRIAFSFFTDDVRQSISEYKADLEQVGSTLDITSIPRNEQLAFWINLHNVAMIDALASQYPLTQVEGEIDQAKLVSFAGIELSPRDIREKIVYPNWRDPKVMYGFWRGAIGGPSIQRIAYTGGNVDALLSLSAEEFVNSLRGVERWYGTLRLSPIYDEAAQFYFTDDAALRAHLTQYAREGVSELIAETPKLAFKTLETDIADLQRGERDPSLVSVCGGYVGANPGGITSINERLCDTPQTRYNAAILRLLDERSEKLERARREGIRSGMVIYGDGEYSPEDIREVE